MPEVVECEALETVAVHSAEEHLAHCVGVEPTSIGLMEEEVLLVEFGANQDPLVEHVSSVFAHHVDRALVERDRPAALPDRYCDGLLTDSDPTDASSWLLPALQAELDSVSEKTRLRFSVLRALRNFFTHDSAESAQRLTVAIKALAASDPRFELGQPVTRCVINDWLRSQSLRRLGLLTSCVPAIWRAMVVVEALAASS